jgi:hypothetical protein
VAHVPENTAETEVLGLPRREDVALIVAVLVSSGISCFFVYHVLPAVSVRAFELYALAALILQTTPVGDKVEPVGEFHHCERGLEGLSGQPTGRLSIVLGHDDPWACVAHRRLNLPTLSQRCTRIGRLAVLALDPEGGAFDIAALACGSAASVILVSTVYVLSEDRAQEPRDSALPGLALVLASAP